MEKMYNFFWSKISKRKVYDEYGDCIGRLYDMYVMTNKGYPKIIGYKIKDGGEMINYEFKDIRFEKTDDDKIHIRIKGARDIIPTTYSYLLSEHLLHRTIVDVNDKKIVKVNDVRVAEITGDIRIVAIDSGIKGKLRRFGIYKYIKIICRVLKITPKVEIILWDNLESIDMVSNESLKLNTSYKKISKLHPADLADILEDMDAEYRNKIFESLDENLAADTLEEIEPEVQKEILENLSESKTAEVLENMPNDEIADILDELDDATAEKIFTSIEREDAEEIKGLMKYNDATVGSIMNKDFIAFNLNVTIEEAMEVVKNIEIESEVSHYIYVTDKDNKLQGVISLKELIEHDSNEKIRTVMNKNLIWIKDNDDIAKAFNLITKYKFVAIPVLDNKGELCGVTVIHDIIEEYMEQKLYR